MTIYAQLTEDQFDAEYPLVRNHLNPHASWGDAQEGGCLFETFGEELDFIRAQDPAYVWTLVDCDEGSDGDLLLVSGFHFVNRLGYLLSTVPVPAGQTIEVLIPMNGGDA